LSVLSLDLTLLPGLIPIMGESENENLDLWLTNSLLHISVPIWGHIDQIPKKKKLNYVKRKQHCCVVWSQKHLGWIILPGIVLTESQYSGN